MLLIDAYNVLHADPPADLAGLGEPGLCLLLDRSGWARRGRRVVVVCDGLPKPHSLDPGRLESVELRFSGASQTADDVISDLLAADSAARRATVVSDDRQVRADAKRQGAKPLGCEAFLIQLANQTLRKSAGFDPKRERPGTARGKPGDGSIGPWATQAWLRAFGIDASDPGLRALDPDTKAPQPSRLEQAKQPRKVEPAEPPDPPRPAGEAADAGSNPGPTPRTKRKPKGLDASLEAEMLAAGAEALPTANRSADPLDGLDLVHLEALFRAHRLDEALERIDRALHGLPAPEEPRNPPTN
ncbi:MAG: NYN domain-containing protein [Planctomycetota bacterium]